MEEGGQVTSSASGDIDLKWSRIHVYHTHFRGTICPQCDKRLNPAATAHMEPSSGSSTSPGLSSSENQEENKEKGK